MSSLYETSHHTCSGFIYSIFPLSPLTPICTANGISHKCQAGLKASRPNFDLTLLPTRSPHSALTHSPIGVGLSVSTNSGNSFPFSLFLTRNNLYAFEIYHHHLNYLFSFSLGIVTIIYVLFITL